MPSQIREKWLKKYNVASVSPISASSSSEFSPIRQKWMKKYGIEQDSGSSVEQTEDGILNKIGNFLSEKFSKPAKISHPPIQDQTKTLDDVSQLTPAQRYGEIRQAPALPDENALEFLGRQLKGSVDRIQDRVRMPEFYRMSEEAKQAEDIERFKQSVAAKRASKFTENNPMLKTVLGAFGRTPEAAVALAPAVMGGPAAPFILGLQGAQGGVEATPDTEVGPDVLNKVMGGAAGALEALVGAKALSMGTRGKGFIKPFLGTEAAGTAQSMIGRDITPENVAESAAENVLPSLLFAKIHQKGQERAKNQLIEAERKALNQKVEQSVKDKMKEVRGEMLRDKVVEGTKPKYFTTETDAEPLSESELQSPPFQATAKRPPRRTIISSNAEPIVEGKIEIKPEDFGLQSQPEYDASASQKGAQYINKPLTSFIKKRGGLSVNAETLAGQVTGMKGELLQLRDSDPNLVKVRKTPFVSRQEASKSLDRTLEAAIEEGLMPEGSTVNDFIQKIDAEQRRTEKLPVNDAAINRMEIDRVENETPFPMKDWEASGVNEIQAGVLSKGDKFKTATDTYKVIDDKIVDDRRQITLKDGVEIVVGENERIPATKYLGKEKVEKEEPVVPFKTVESAKAPFEQPIETHQPIKSTVNEVLQRTQPKTVTSLAAPKMEPEINQSIQQTTKDKEFRSRVYERAQAEYGEILKDNLLYDVQRIKDNTDKAVDLMIKDRNKSYRVAMGYEKAEPVEQAMSNIVMRQKALDDGNNDLYVKLIRRGSMEQTKRGQAIAMEKASVTDNSPDRYVKELLNAKMNELGSSYLADVADMAGEIKGTVQKVFKSKKIDTKESPMQRAQKVIEKETSKALEKIAPNKRIDIQEAQRLIDSLVCK